MTIYRFVHISDLLTVPPERREVCLRELSQALATISAGVVAAQANGDPRPVAVMVPHITWDDNGDVNTVVRFQDGGRIEVHVNKPAIPAGVYYDKDTDCFFSDEQDFELDMMFWRKWLGRCEEFPPLPAGGLPCTNT